MKKNFLFNAFFVLLVNVLIKPLYLFGIDRNVQIITGENYGLYYTFFSLAFILNILSDFGIQNFNLRFSSQSQVAIQKNFSKFLGIKLLLALLFFLFYSVAGMATSYAFDHTGLFFMVGICLWLNSFLLFIRSFIAAKGLYLVDSILSVTDKTIMIVVMGGILLYPQWRSMVSISLFVQLQILSYLFSILLGLGILISKKSRFWPQWDKKFTIAILKQSFPYALVILLMSVYARIDSVMLAWIHPDKVGAVDAYAESFRIFEALNMLGFLLSGLLLPMFSKQYKSKSSIEDLFQKGLGISASLAIPVAVSIYFFAREIMETLYFHDGGAVILKWHILAFAVNTVSYVFGTLITAAGKIARLNMLFLVAVVLNILLNAIVIPWAGAEGAALTSLLTQCFVFIGQAYYAYEKLELTFSSKFWMQILLFIVVVGLLNGWASGLNSNWMVLFFVTVSAGMVFSLLFRIIDLRSFVILLRSKINS